MENTRAHDLFSHKYVIIGEILDTKKERVGAKLPAHTFKSGSYLLSSHGTGESTRAVPVPQAAFPCGLNLQVWMQRDGVISHHQRTLTSLPPRGKRLAGFWSGFALLIPLNWLRARIHFGGNGKEN